MNYKTLPAVINAIGVIAMIVWGTMGNDWGHSWIAICISGVLSSLIYTFGKQKEEDQKKDE